ncbi:hypothetical protein QUB08_15145 [Microcoleus sp. BR0-C5]|uniref:hypothetical protein n=1 Tax=Microcoleus sp. BR0-C5 TaxID=2818713 RepID=UPI002FD22568
MSYDEIKSIFTQVHSSQQKTVEIQHSRVSIDEISMRKVKGSLVTVVSDIDGGNLIEMIDSHRQPDIFEARIKQPF